MNKLQFQVLYRQFLFRMVDLELLSASAQGDINRLLGRFAAILIWLSVALSIGILMGGGGSPGQPADVGLIVAWAMEHFLIATTMLAVGLFAVISWDSMFPDRRDVLVLSPLPVTARTLFAAKVAAVGAALGVSILALNGLTGFAVALGGGSAPTIPPPKYDAAIPSVSLENLPAVLESDMTPALHGDGALAWYPQPGLTVGVWRDRQAKILTYGTGHPDSIYMIGSISKTFTGLILARMVEQGLVRLDQPVRELLPPGTVEKPSGREITLLDLATHHSGLPRDPDNVRADAAPDPMANYHQTDLFAFLKNRGVSRPDDAEYLYSNLGFGLLGEALALRAGTTYEELLRREVTEPLGMRDTVISLSEEQHGRTMRAYDWRHQLLPEWNLDALAGAGAIRSTAPDMLRYLVAQLHPEAVPELASAIRLSHRIQADVNDKARIGLAWMQRSGLYRHDGSIAGFTSDSYFSPDKDYAVVVLLNTQAGLFGSFATEQLGDHIRQRLAGEPAISLANPIHPADAFLGPVRMFFAYWFTMLATGTFTFCFVLTIQGLAQLLPRQKYLRVSAFLQIAAFVLFVSMYFTQLPFASPEDLASPKDARLLTWLPSYWFFGMLQQLDGSQPPQLVVFTQRAWIGLGASIAGAIAAYLICYLRTLRRIAEQPDILPSRAGLRWLPRFGGSLQTAVAQFSIRTLARSRKHRVTLAFYLGMAFAIILFITKAPELAKQSVGDRWHQPNPPMLMATILVMLSAIIGIRVAFAMPIELRANWIFRLMPLSGGKQYLKAARRSLYALAMAPAWCVSAAVLFSLWPRQQAAEHLALLALIGLIAIEGLLISFRKIPFTCSYLPGKVNLLVVWISYLFIGLLMAKGLTMERQALIENPRGLIAIGAGLAIAAGALRWLGSRLADQAATPIEFEETLEPAVLSLGLSRDGMPVR